MLNKIAVILTVLMCHIVIYADTINLSVCQPKVTTDYPIEKLEDIRVFFDDGAVFYRYSPATNEKQQVLDFVPYYFVLNEQFALVVQETETEKRWLSLNLETFIVHEIFSEAKPELMFNPLKSLTENRFLLEQSTGYLTLEDWYVVDLPTATMQQFPFPELVDFMSVVDSMLVTPDERSKDRPYIYSFNADMSKISYWAYDIGEDLSQKPKVITRVQDIASGDYVDLDERGYLWSRYPNLIAYHPGISDLYDNEVGLINISTETVVARLPQTPDLFSGILFPNDQGTVASEIFLRGDTTYSYHVGIFDVLDKQPILTSCLKTTSRIERDIVGGNELFWTASGQYLWWLEPQVEFGRVYNLMLFDTETGISGIVMRNVSSNTRIVETFNYGGKNG